MIVNERLGQYRTSTIGGETYRSYIPAALPPQPPIEVIALAPYLESAHQALAELKVATRIIPNVALLVYMYVRKEAVLSSQIEGTQSSLADLVLFENEQQPLVALDDVEEVSNYVSALNYAFQRMDEGLPLSLRLLKEAHGVLLSGARGMHKLPGEFRRSQNWIGGSCPGNALFVPPAPEDMMACLGDWELFLYEQKSGLPLLVKIGIAHVQFETIHPFLDGNGRLGRLLISILLRQYGFLDYPVLYLSLYLKRHRTLYYELLQRVRLQGDWEAWLRFFLEGVQRSALQGVLTAQKINTLFDVDKGSIAALGRVRFSAEKVFELFKKLPQLSVPVLVSSFGFHPSTARSALEALVGAGIAVEITAKKRDRVYVYKRYLMLLEEESMG